MEIHIGNRVAEVELLSKQGNKVSIQIDGTVYDVDVAMTERGGCSLLYGNKSYNAEFMRTSDDGKHYKVNANFSTYDVEIVDTEAKYLQMKRSDNARQDSRMVAPMPGKIVSIAVKEGQRLNAGDTCIVIEAMKMQSNYKVTADCTVERILVEEGQTVSANQTLMTLEV